MYYNVERAVLSKYVRGIYQSRIIALRVFKNVAPNENFQVTTTLRTVVVSNPVLLCTSHPPTGLSTSIASGTALQDEVCSIYKWPRFADAGPACGGSLAA